MVKREETIEELEKQKNNLTKEKKTIQSEINRLKEKKCSFCQKLLPTDKNYYLKNRYKCKFWNNNAKDERLICFTCLKYAYTRNLPLISNKQSARGWSKQRTFKQYIKIGYFKEENV